MTEKAWKRAERRIAQMLGSRWVPVSGRQRGNAADVAHPTLSVEVKLKIAGACSRSPASLLS
jgi:hypothetical protein